MKRIGTMNIKEILQHRHEFGLTRAQTATAVGVSTGTIPTLWSGRRRRGYPGRCRTISTMGPYRASTTGPRSNGPS